MMNLNYFCPKDELPSMTASVSRGSGPTRMAVPHVQNISSWIPASKFPDGSVVGIEIHREHVPPKPLASAAGGASFGLIQWTNRTKICSEQQQKELLWSVWTQEGQRDSVSRGVLKRNTVSGAEQVYGLFLSQEPALNDWNLSRSKRLW